MSKTGVIRRIDDLGRVVITREIRRALRIREGDHLEMWIQDEGIFIKKYSFIGNLECVQQYAESLNEILGHIALIADRDVIIAIAGGDKREFLNKPIGIAIGDAMDERITLQYNNGMEYENRHVIQMDGNEYKIQDEIIVPIICQGDVLGAVIILTKEQNITFGETEIKLAEVTAKFLAKQAEQ